MELKPHEVRLSPTFLLSDFLGCSSVYRKGLPNYPDFGVSRTYVDALMNEGKQSQGSTLAHYLDLLNNTYGPCSVTYGFIRPETSREIVKYQDPDKPSYHRWDLGAAADVVFHDQIHPGDNSLSPIVLANSIRRDYPSFSRLITYAESPVLCIATKREEFSHNSFRTAFYENRFTGARKPEFLKHTRARTDAQVIEDLNGVPWAGRGWPSYHIGGVKQYEHIRIGQYTLLSDVLYVPEKVEEGIPNKPPAMGDDLKKFRKMSLFVGDYLNALTQRTGSRVSVVRGYNSDEKKFAWINGRARLTVALHEQMDHRPGLSEDAGQDILSVTGLGRGGEQAKIKNANIYTTNNIPFLDVEVDAR